MRPAFLVFTSLGWSSDREHRLAFRPPDPGHAPSLSTASREVRQRASPPAPQSSPGAQLSGQKLPEAARQVHPRRPFVASESSRNGLHLLRPLGRVNLSIRSTRPEAVVIWPLDLSPVRLASLDFYGHPSHCAFLHATQLHNPETHRTPVHQSNVRSISARGFRRPPSATGRLVGLAQQVARGSLQTLHAAGSPLASAAAGARAWGLQGQGPKGR
jgi:hypothetical protein